MSRTTRKVRQGKVDIDFADPALLVNYELETVVLDDNNRVVDVIESTSEQKRIKIKSLVADKDMGQMAADIVDKCKYIHPSRTEEIEQLLIKLRKHFNSKESEKDKAESKRQEDRDKINRERRDEEEEEGGSNSASMDNLSDYLDLLYQVSGSSDHEKDSGLKSQVHGTKMILSLCQDVMNLEQLIQNTTVMGALTRVLQEEYKKSLELTFNILRIFLAFSNFTEMHGLMANYRVGLLTMKVIEFEVRRAEHRNDDLTQRNAENEEGIARVREEGGDLKRLLESTKKAKDKEERKWAKQSQKQDKVLFVAFYILINLAEDVSVEQKMLKKGLVESLLSMLDRTYGELLILLITFLKKLSIFEENKALFKSLKFTPKLARFIPCSSQPLTNMSLRLLFNLSFDEEMRDQMMRNGLVPKLVDLLKTPAYRSRTLKLLYHLSIDDRCKSMFSYTDGVPLLMGMVINFPQDALAKELAALVINISHSPKNCELMVQNHGLNHLMDRLSSTRDPLLIKIIRNITCWTFNQQQEDQPELHYKWRGLWSPHLKIFLEITRESDSHDVLVEVYGCLANMTPLDLPANSSWHRIAKEFSFFNQFSKVLVPGMSQNDVILEIVMLIGAMASDPKVCEMLSSGNLINTLYQIWRDKGDDVEIKLQLVHCFHKLFLNETSREEVMYSTRVVVDIIDCLSHKNAAVRAASDRLTELVLEHDRKAGGELGALGVQIRKKRYEGYNRKWLAAVNHASMDRSDLSSFDNIDDSGGDVDDRMESKSDRYNYGYGGKGGYDRDD